ncbi:MAG: T9SS type A sorting domain-containing protein [Bacteroidota bacterium]
MKKFLLLFTVLIVGGIFFMNRDKHTPKIHEISDPLEVEGFTGAELFSQYHSLIRQSPEGSPYTYSSGYQTREYKKIKKTANNPGSRDFMWEERGPGNVSGRSRALWIDPRDETGNTWFVGSAQGGVWKTEDGGQTYTIKTPDIPHMGTAAIMGCTSDPNVLYAGSGEGFNLFSAAGAGIFKSVDGGETWSVLESTVENEAFANVMRLAVNHEDPNIVLAATRNNNSVGTTEGYIMRSKDGGETWEEVLNHFDIIPHLVMSPDDSNVMYAGLNQEGVLKTTDGGDNWDFVWLFADSSTRPERIEIAISPTDPNYVYFTTPINEPGAFAEDKIFVSDDAGATFQEIIPNTNDDFFGNFSGGQSFWNKAIAVDPFNPLKVYVGGQSAILAVDVSLGSGLAIGELSVISDGYSSFSREGFETSTKGVHVDHHGIYFHVTDEVNQEAIMINTNDGGVAVSRDMGATFTQTGDTFLQAFNPEEGEWETVDGFNVSTFYGVDKMNGADRYVGGTQDNGSWVSPENPDAASRWSHAPSGDGFEAAWNYNDPDLIIESSQFNNLSRSVDGGETWSRLQTPGFGPFVTAVANSKQDGDMVMISTTEGPALSLDFGTNWILSSVPNEYVYNGLRMPIKISLFDPNVAWTGSGVTDFSRICVSQDGGKTFTATSAYAPQVLGEVSGIATHPADAATAYAILGTAGLPKVIRTTDFGQTWEDISGFEGTTDGTSSRGFPDVAAFCLLVMPYDNDIIWVGTEIGIIESLDGGLTWNMRDDELPATAIWEMMVINDEIVVATHGRGIWTTSVDELEGYEPPIPFLVSSKFKGDSFDKKLTGVIQHLTPSDSGHLTVTVETAEEVFTRRYDFGEITEPGEEEINLNLEDFDIGDIIYDAEITITSYRGEQESSRSLTSLFYDVDAEDQMIDYTNNFDDGKEDFAVGMVTNGSPDFSISAPEGFDNNGLESVHDFGGSLFRAILQKPITIASSGTTINFEEIALTQAAVEFTGGSFFRESIVIEATKDKGKTWIRLEEYSSEAHEVWEDLAIFGEPPTPDLYRDREIILSDYFDEGDEVYIKWEMNIEGFSFSWGYIMDNLDIEGTVSTKEEILEKGISMKTYLNPFITSTQVDLTYPAEYEVGKAHLIGLNGQVFNNAITETKTPKGKRYGIDGSNLPAGVYFLKVNVGSEVLTEKIIRM